MELWESYQNQCLRRTSRLEPTPPPSRSLCVRRRNRTRRARSVVSALGTWEQRRRVCAGLGEWPQVTCL